jgi:DNA-binding NtrC family response regulator
MCAAKIVVVDGEPTVRSVMTRILKRAGYDVQSASNAQTALELIKTSTPDLVITNVYLPGITGHDAMKLIKENCPGVPVLMVSGLPDDDLIRNWIGQDGFDAFPKPFGADSLIEKVREMMSGPQRTRGRN